MVIFQYNLDIFVWIKHGCLTNTVYVMDPNNSFIKRLWCTTSYLDLRKGSGITKRPGNLSLFKGGMNFSPKKKKKKEDPQKSATDIFFLHFGYFTPQNLINLVNR